MYQIMSKKRPKTNRNRNLQFEFADSGLEKFSIHDVARYAGCAPTTAAKWTRAFQIKPDDYGMFGREDLAEFLDITARARRERMVVVPRRDRCALRPGAKIWLDPTTGLATSNSATSRKSGIGRTVTYTSAGDEGVLVRLERKCLVFGSSPVPFPDGRAQVPLRSSEATSSSYELDVSVKIPSQSSLRELVDYVDSLGVSLDLVKFEDGARVRARTK